MNFSEPGCANTTTTTTTATTNGTSPLRLAHQLFSDLSPPPKRTDFTAHLTALHTAAHLLLLPQSDPAEHSFRQREHARVATGPLGPAVLTATTLFLLNTCRGDAPVGHRRHNEDDDEGSDQTTRQQGDIYEATGRMLQDLAAEREGYLDNMARLLEDMKARWKEDLIATGSWHRTALTLGKSGIASAQALADLVGHRPVPSSTTTTTIPCNDDDDDSGEGRKRTRGRGKGNGKGQGAYLSEIARYWRMWSGSADGTGDEDGSGMFEEVWSYVAGRALVGE